MSGWVCEEKTSTATGTSTLWRRDLPSGSTLWKTVERNKSGSIYGGELAVSMCIEPYAPPGA